MPVSGYTAVTLRDDDLAIIEKLKKGNETDGDVIRRGLSYLIIFEDDKFYEYWKKIIDEYNKER